LYALFMPSLPPFAPPLYACTFQGPDTPPLNPYVLCGCSPGRKEGYQERKAGYQGRNDLNEGR
jgi:hypothetical protein